MPYLQTVTPDLLNIIRALSAAPAFASFRLVGGTALSLYLGHRQSVDADFFTSEPFEMEMVMREMTALFPGFQIIQKTGQGFTGVHQGVKVDLYQWGASFLLPPTEEEGMRMAALPDVAALKMEAVINRKEEKDFRDMHALLEKFSLAELLGFFQVRYPQYSPRMFTDHLLAVSHVERDDSIHLLKTVTWEEVGASLTAAVRLFFAEKTKQANAKAEDEMRRRLAAIKERKKKK